MEANFIAEGAVRIPCGAIAFKISTNANLSGQSPSILLRKTVLSLKHPTGVFVAAQTRTCRGGVLYKERSGSSRFPQTAQKSTLIFGVGYAFNLCRWADSVVG